MSNRISILNASVEDFALEIVSSAPANGSVGDNENGRLVKFGEHIYVWCDHQGIWAKFANVSDFTSLETRLSVQEDANDTDVAALEAADASLEGRISTEEDAMATAISSINALATSAEGSLETRLAGEEVARAADVDSAEASAIAAEGSVDAKLSVAKSERIAAVDSLETRAIAAETSLSSRISIEKDTKDADDLSRGADIDAAIASRSTADADIVSVMAVATQSRISNDASLESAISIEEARISAILHASTADKDSFAEIVSHINAIDLAHDTQTSTEVASLTSDIDSMELSLGAVDSAFETDLSSEEDTMTSADATLSSRLATEESNMESEDSVLTTAVDSEVAARLAADNTIGGDIGVNTVARTAADTSLSTRMSNEEASMEAEDLSLETLLSGDASDRASDDSSIQSDMADEESAMLSAIASEEVARIAADSTLTSSISSEEVDRADEDVVLSARVSNEEDAMAAADASLQLRLSNEEDTMAADIATLSVNLASELVDRASGDSSVETRFSNEISTEKSKINAILDSADADKDTFVELVSFITEFDVDADDALASYQLVIDSRITAEESNMAAGDLSIGTELAAKIVERQSVVTSLETKHDAEISSLTSAVDSVEVREGNRHFRVGFGGTTPVTSFSVPGTSFPSGFKMNDHGMVQVFQDMGSNKFRHLVAPVEIDMSSGDITVQLGSSAKAGFAVFYMFADDEGAVTAPSSADSLGLGGYSNEMATSQGGASDLEYTTYIKDYNNLDQYGQPTGLHSMGYDLGAGAQTKWYIRMYDASSPSSFSNYTYTFTGNESGYGGDQLGSYEMGQAGVTLSENGYLEVYAEVYDANGDLVGSAGSSSAPYFASTPVSYGISVYATGITASPSSAAHGQTVDVTVTVDLATASAYASFINLSGNSDAYSYGWNSYDTMWTAQSAGGTPSSYEQDLIDYFNNNIYNPNGYVSHSFPNQTLPAVGSYSYDIVAANASAPSSPTTFKITLVVS